MTTIIFDYDWSLINCNSDTYIFEKLLETNIQNISPMTHVKKGLSWTHAVNAALVELHDITHCTSLDILNCIGNVPMQDGMIHALQYAKMKECQIYILSDANTIFIKAMLVQYNLESFVNGIVTNGACFLQDGLLQITPFHDENKEKHGCKHCPLNLCKGSVVTKWMEEKEIERIVYIGDGRGDFCPALKLKR